MGLKTIFIIIVSVLVTVILMNNTDEVHFWIFGDARIPKLAVLGVMFVLGFIVGFMAGRPRKKTALLTHTEPAAGTDKQYHDSDNERRDYLSDEDRDYIK